MTTAVAITAIDLYQRFLSPYKGFRCAHRARHGRSSCSQFAKRLIAKVGVLRFWPILMRRFKRCGDAARALKANWANRSNGLRKSLVKAQRDPANRKRRESWTRHCDAPCDCVPNVGGCDAPSAGCDSMPVDAGASDCPGGCDISL